MSLSISSLNVPFQDNKSNLSPETPFHAVFYSDLLWQSTTEIGIACVAGINYAPFNQNLIFNET